MVSSHLWPTSPTDLFEVAEAQPLGTGWRCLLRVLLLLSLLTGPEG